MPLILGKIWLLKGEKGKPERNVGPREGLFLRLEEETQAWLPANGEIQWRWRESKEFLRKCKGSNRWRVWP